MEAKPATEVAGIVTFSNLSTLVQGYGPLGLVVEFPAVARFPDGISPGTAMLSVVPQEQQGSGGGPD